MSPKEETELIERVQRHGDRRAADAIARAHWPFVVKFALKYQSYGVPLDDLIAEAHVGFLHALRKFDAGRGVRFLTYAKHWMRAFVLKHVLANWSIVSGGSTVMRPRWFFLLRRERARLASALGDGDAADGELAQRLGLPRQKVRRMLDRLDTRDLSLDAERSPNSPVRMVDHLPAADDQELSLFELEFRESLKNAVDRALSRLGRRERYIVERRMMVEAGDGATLADIGRAFGVSRERARQLEVRTARKLRETVVADPVVHEWLSPRRAATSRPARTAPASVREAVNSA